MESGIPLSYVTTGQRVPEDLALASPDDLAERILLSEE
jgi:flagellar biosynthesis GTPase FlhF